MKTMNDAKIRVQSEIICATLMRIAAETAELQAAYDKLYEELEYADPRRDRQFERFMVTFVRGLNALKSDRMTELASAAKEMCSFVSGRQPETMITAPAAQPTN